MLKIQCFFFYRLEAASQILCPTNSRSNYWKLELNFHLPKKNCFICFNLSPLKIKKNAFYFILKPLFVPKTLNFLFFWSHRKYGLVKKITLFFFLVNFKCCDVIIWITNRYNTAQYLTKQRPPDNETWSVNRIQNENSFF